MNQVSTKQNIAGTEVGITWIPTQDVEKYQPCRQVYGICFNDKNEILIIKDPDSDKWQIPGGTPEEGESREETLIREIQEEADVLVKDCKPLGVQQIDHPNNPNKTDGDRFYQYRYICSVANILEQTPDPATKITFDRKFVQTNEITNYVKWGETGKAMFEDAIKLQMSL